MTIIYISSEYPPETGNGGIGTYTKYIAQGMSTLGHKVYVICRTSGTEPARKTIHGVHVHRIPPSTFPLPEGRLFFSMRVLMRKMFYHTLVRLSWAIAAGKEVESIAREESVSVIEYPECGAEGLCIPKNIKALKVVRLHTPWSMVKKMDNIKECPGDELLFPYLELHSIRQAHLVSSPSKALRQKIRMTRTRQGSVIPNPIDTRIFSRSCGNCWIYTGRVEHRKGVHILLQAYIDLFTTHTPPQLLIVGAPYGTDDNGVFYGDTIESLIRNCGHQDRITWYKGVPPEEVRSKLQQSTVAFFPSLWENFPYTCLEAMASGCAVVASDCGGFPEMITHNVNGLLFPAFKPEALLSVMKELLDHPERIRQLGESAAICVAREFDSTTVCRQTELLYLSEIEA
jgi:glycosyltransferase involved in cell wall biosynthesis